jgi:hypothetical protein
MTAHLAAGGKNFKVFSISRVFPHKDSGLAISPLCNCRQLHLDQISLSRDIYQSDNCFLVDGDYLVDQAAATRRNYPFFFITTTREQEISTFRFSL